MIKIAKFGGSSVADALTFGRIAGKSAATR